MSKTETRFRVLDDFPDFRVGDNGTVWRFCGGKWVLAPLRDRDGYKFVTLCNGRRRRSVGVHLLVLEVFVGPRPEGMICCHFPDRDRSNNRLSNLRWDTPHANNDDARFHEWVGRIVGNPEPLFAATRIGVDERAIIRLHNEGFCSGLIACHLGLTPRYVTQFLRELKLKK